jgi:hypothetical protein
MPKLLIASATFNAADAEADIVIIPGDFGPTPVRAMASAEAAFLKPVVMIAGKTELDGVDLVRRLAEGRMKSHKSRVQFLEQRSEVIEGVRFIGSHNADLGFILAALEEPYEGPTVIVTYEPPPEDISAIMRAGKVARWIYPASTSEPLIVEI